MRYSPRRAGLPDRPGRTGPLPDHGGPWELLDPRRDCAVAPYTDEHSARLLDEAATSLVLLRSPMWLGDAGPAISALASLAAQADDLLFEAIASARDQDYTWDEIAGRLACSAITARRQYAPYTRRNVFDDGD
jgi:hypothetical protein